MKAEDFLKNVWKGNSCWLWTASTNGKYGQLWLGEKKYSAHRFAYEKYFGRIPKGKHVCHHCDNPLCVNPEHLFVGTARENVRDCWQKGRAFTPFRKRILCARSHQYNTRPNGEKVCQKCINQGSDKRRRLAGKPERRKRNQ